MDDSTDELPFSNEASKPTKSQLSNHDSKFYEETLVRLVQRGKRLREAMVKSLHQTYENENRSEKDLPKPTASMVPVNIQLYTEIGNINNLLQRPERSKRNAFVTCRINKHNSFTTPTQWNTNNPSFHFSKTFELTLNSEFLQYAERGYVVYEIWDRYSNVQDELIGLVKLPLHPYYIAFQVSASGSSLSPIQTYPIMSVHNYVPIHNPVTGTECGFIKILLAMGSEKQVNTLILHQKVATIIQKQWRGYRVRKRFPGVALKPKSSKTVNKQPSTINRKLTKRSLQEDFERENKLISSYISRDRPSTPLRHEVKVYVESIVNLPPLFTSKTADAVYPDVYVSYAPKDNNVIHTTRTIPNTSSPLFGDCQTTFLSPEELKDYLSLSVYHQKDPKKQNPKVDQLLGTAKVDLINLTCGLREINGWYHIMDYNKQKKGQMKVRIVPDKVISLPRPSQYIEVAVNRSFIDDDGEIDMSLEELRSVKQEILRTPIKNSYALEPSDTIAKLENLKKDILRSPASSRETSFSYEPRSRAPSKPADTYYYAQSKIMTELNTRSDEELKEHFSSAMNNLDSLLKNLKTQLDEEHSFSFSVPTETKPVLPEPVIMPSPPKVTYVPPEEIKPPSPIQAKQVETSSQTDISYDHNITLDDKNVSTEQHLLDETFGSPIDDSRNYEELHTSFSPKLQTKVRPEIRIIASTSSELSEILSSLSFVEKPNSPSVIKETKSIATEPEGPVFVQETEPNESIEEKDESMFNLSTTSIEKSPRQEKRLNQSIENTDHEEDQDDYAKELRALSRRFIGKFTEADTLRLAKIMSTNFS